LLATSDSTDIVLYDLTQSKKVKSIPLGDFLSTNRISEFRFQFRFHLARPLLAISSLDQTNVLILDVESGNVAKKLPHAKPVFQPAWHPDGRYLATGCSDQSLYIWDTATGERVRTLACNTVSVTFSRAGNLLAASGWDGETYLWDFP